MRYTERRWQSVYPGALARARAGSYLGALMVLPPGTPKGVLDVLWAVAARAVRS